MKLFKLNFFTVIIFCLTLGLAPFSPEPHIWGKLKWVIGGAEGMGMMDWFDLLIHGSPWLLLAFFLIQKVTKKQ